MTTPIVRRLVPAVAGIGLLVGIAVHGGGATASNGAAHAPGLEASPSHLQCGSGQIIHADFLRGERGAGSPEDVIDHVLGAHYRGASRGQFARVQSGDVAAFRHPQAEFTVVRGDGGWFLEGMAVCQRTAQAWNEGRQS